MGFQWYPPFLWPCTRSVYSLRPVGQRPRSRSKLRSQSPMRPAASWPQGPRFSKSWGYPNSWMIYRFYSSRMKHGDGSIPITTIFLSILFGGWTSINPSYGLMWTEGVQGFDRSPWPKYRGLCGKLARICFSASVVFFFWLPRNLGI